MPKSTKAVPNHYALLIGIDKYLENELPDGSYYRDLSGCVRDINHVERFLLTTLGIPRANITKLTASDNGSDKPAEPRKLWPTYENMVAGFNALTRKAKAGDQVYIHYSGHGGIVESLIPKLKSNGLDESLVPTNIGHSEARYLRDVEMATLLRTMTDKKLIVTMVLDSCHSAGMTRGPDVRVRGLGSVDTTKRPTDSLIGSRAELAATWKRVKGDTARGVSAVPWIPASEGAIVLSACGSTESAYEYAFDGVESNGALTYWFLNSLSELGLNLTYKQLHDRIVAKVHSYFAIQTPHLEGDGSRIVFGMNHIPESYRALVMAVDPGGRRLLLNAGQAQGVRRGSQFAIHSLAGTGQKDLGVATIETLGATDSWADFASANGTVVKQGDQAVLINPGSIRLVKGVRLLNESGSSSKHKTVLDRMESAITNSPWLKLIKGGKAANYQVVLNKNREFEICDSSGRDLTTHVAASKAATATVVSRLEHLTKYHGIQELDNHDTTSPLSRKLSVEWVGYQNDFELGEKPKPRRFPAGTRIPTVKIGTWIFLKIKNLSDSLLNVVVLDLQPDWGISQVHPFPPLWFTELEAGCEELVPLEAYLPKSYKEGTDILKVFASLSTPHFHWLQMEPLDGAVSVAKDQLRQASGLDLLLDALSDQKPAMRHLNPAAYPSRGWTTSQVELYIRK
jgi:hypothetical protein